MRRFRLATRMQGLGLQTKAVIAAGTFRLVGRELGAGERAGTTAAMTSYVPFRDPAEGAWSLEVPEGWTARGGVRRGAPIDVRHGFEAVSPDGGARIFSGDDRIPTYALPTAISRFQGFVEGSPCSPGGGVQEEIRSYMPGQQFAEFYVRNYLAPRCGAITITESRNRPEIAQIANAPLQRAGSLRRASVGQVTVSCQAPDGRRLEGMCLARTDVAGVASPGGIWTVPSLFGYLATAAELPAAREATAHMLSSFRVNPDWVKMQLGVTSDASIATAEAARFTSEIVAAVSGRREASMDELARRRANATLGVEDLTDPVTGRHFRVESGANYYWVDPAGNIAGTSTATAPAIDFRELLRIR
jgi:hypothetical protein